MKRKLERQKTSLNEVLTETIVFGVRLEASKIESLKRNAKYNEFRKSAKIVLNKLIEKIMEK